MFGKSQLGEPDSSDIRPNFRGEDIALMLHDGCGGIAGKAELLTGIESMSILPSGAEDSTQGALILPMLGAHMPRHHAPPCEWP
jgi:hypothetical protein